MVITATFDALCRPRLAILVAALLAGQTQGVSAQASSGVREAEVRFAAALMSGDVETAVSFFAEEGTVVAGTCSEIKGRADVRSFLIALVRSGNRLSLTPGDVAQTGGADAREIGTFRLSGSSLGTGSRDGRYTTTWVKRETGWKVSAMAWMLRGIPHGKGIAPAPDSDRCMSAGSP